MFVVIDSMFGSYEFGFFIQILERLLYPCNAKCRRVPNFTHLKVPLLTLLYYYTTNIYYTILFNYLVGFTSHPILCPWRLPLLSFVPSAGRWWKHGTNTVTPVASCAPTVTSTSNRRVTSSWRGSCTVRLTLVLEWDHRRDTTSSRPFPPRSFPS